MHRSRRLDFGRVDFLGGLLAEHAEHLGGAGGLTATIELPLQVSRPTASSAGGAACS
jgi:hypothetical protein